MRQKLKFLELKVPRLAYIREQMKGWHG